jgi:hypothetical protein
MLAVNQIAISSLVPRRQSQEVAMKKQQSKPAPLETDPGEQKDDNIDDLGRKPDGSREDQPTKPSKS